MFQLSGWLLLEGSRQGGGRSPGPLGPLSFPFLSLFLFFRSFVLSLCLPLPPAPVDLRRGEAGPAAIAATRQGSLAHPRGHRERGSHRSQAAQGPSSCDSPATGERTKVNKPNRGDNRN